MVQCFGGTSGDGSPEFSQLLQAMRRLQLAGELTIQYKEVNRIGQVFLKIGTANSVQDAAEDDLKLVRRLLKLSNQKAEYEFVYGQDSSADSIPLVTRSVLGILGDLGAEIEVPLEDVESGATKATVRLVEGETRPTIVVHVGEKTPRNPYVTIPYRGHHYWIDPEDFDSKYAFTIVENLMALFEINDTSKTPIVTIPPN